MVCIALYFAMVPKERTALSAFLAELSRLSDGRHRSLYQNLCCGQILPSAPQRNVTNAIMVYRSPVPSSVPRIVFVSIGELVRVQCQLWRDRRRGQWSFARRRSLPIGEARCDGIENNHPVRLRLPLLPLGRQAYEHLGKYSHEHAGDLIFGARFEDTECRADFIAPDGMHGDAFRFGHRLYRFEDRFGGRISRQPLSPLLPRHNAYRGTLPKKTLHLSLYPTGPIFASRRDRACSPIEEPFRS